jgi:hypothetical protein
MHSRHHNSLELSQRLSTNTVRSYTLNFGSLAKLVVVASVLIVDEQSDHIAVVRHVHVSDFDNVTDVAIDQFFFSGPLAAERKDRTSPWVA